jgi:hypothetical protein
MARCDTETHSCWKAWEVLTDYHRDTEFDFFSVSLWFKTNRGNKTCLTFLSRPKQLSQRRLHIMGKPEFKV